MVREQIGNHSEIFLPFIYALFSLFNCNLISNIPYFCCNSSGVVSLGLSITIFIGVTILAFSIHGLNFSLLYSSWNSFTLVPLLVLIELVSYLARSVSLGVRLFANIVAGHTLLKILSTYLFKLFQEAYCCNNNLIPFAIILALIGLEIAVLLYKLLFHLISVFLFKRCY